MAVAMPIAIPIYKEEEPAAANAKEATAANEKELV